MAFAHHESQECTKSELDLLSIPPTQTSISKGQWIEYHPLSNITDTGPIEFNVTGSGDEYLDFARTQLYAKAKITKSNVANFSQNTEVGPTCESIFAFLVFSSGRIPKQATDLPSTNTYPYCAMLETLLNYRNP